MARREIETTTKRVVHVCDLCDRDRLRAMVNGEGRPNE